MSTTEAMAAFDEWDVAMPVACRQRPAPTRLSVGLAAKVDRSASQQRATAARFSRRRAGQASGARRGNKRRAF